MRALTYVKAALILPTSETGISRPSGAEIGETAYMEATPHDPLMLVLRRRRSYRPEGDADLPGGKVNRGESPLGAMLRELVEETGITEDGLEPVGQEPARLWEGYANTERQMHGRERVSVTHICYIGHLTAGAQVDTSRFDRPKADHYGYEFMVMSRFPEETVVPALQTAAQWIRENGVWRPEQYE